MAKEAMRLAAHKLPLKTKFISRAEVGGDADVLKRSGFNYNGAAQKADDLKQELFNLRFQLATGQLDNPMRIREVRRSIARVKTVLRERELKQTKV